MLSSQVIASLLMLIPLTLGYLVDPPTTAPSNTIQDCSGWAVATSTDTCESIADDNFITLSQLYTYNPSLSANSCPLIVGDSYCIEGNFGVPPVTTSTTTSPTGNGVSTPSPVQTGIVGNCDMFYYVQSGDTCSIIAAKYGITLAQFYAWNPAVGSSCLSLGLNDYVCVGTLNATGTITMTATTTTTTKPGNGISTPMPVQTGIVSNCNRFYEVQPGDVCSNIAAAYGIPLQSFYAWNPAVGSSCLNLIAGDYVCIGTTTSSATMTTSTSKSTTTTPGNGISTPTPVQTGIASNCNRFYLVQNGDICDTIAAAEGISVSDLYAWNPAVGVNTCKDLDVGDYICVGVIGFTPTTSTASTTTTTTLGNGITTPTPYQAGMVSDCNDFYFVKSGDTCDNIAADEGISSADFYAWNPAVGGNTCKSLQAGTYACVGVESCTTNTFGLVVPQPSGAVCGIPAVSNGGTTLASYSSGAPVSSFGNCKDAWYLGHRRLHQSILTQGKACNLHAGAETHAASSTSAFIFYESTCFVCPSKCLSASSPPAGAVCNVKAVSNGGTTIISYSSGAPVQSISNCASTCSTSPYSFYDASCFECAPPSCWTNSQGLAVPQPSGAVCGVAAYSNGGTTVVSYASGEPITSLKACSAVCLAISACTNLYYQAGKYCNLHSGADTHNPDTTSPYAFYDASCFEC
ncbi:carbohydrate-binding module family 50 protein [Xylaria sp. FL0933]|nr:carbohydrate-binding module family 50 protein [Xylaria sp. FL0933]